MTLAQTNPDSIVAALERGRKALAECRDDFDRLQVRDQAAAAVAAAKILERRDIQNSAQWLVLRAERAIAQANPPRATGRAAVSVNPEITETLPKQTLSQMRTAATVMTDDDFNAAEQASIASPETEPAPTRSELVKEARRSRQTTATERQAIANEAPPRGDATLHHCAIADLRQHVAADSVDLIFTDPPYERDALPAYIDLANFAAHALKPGGVMLVLSGSAYLPEVLRNLTCNPAIQYVWQMAYMMPGASTMVRAPRIHNNWKPLLAFSKGDYAGEWHSDIVTIPPRRSQENDLHPWQQQAAGIQLALSKWATPGLLVCDPFVGAGTTGAAALALGCGFIGADIDADCIETTRERLG